MKGIISLLCGLLFALGLGISGMTQPQIVRGFLDVFGPWDPRLMGVMVGAIGVHAVTYRFIIKRRSPLLESEFHLPTRKDINLRLLTGAALFGLGWGQSGICPGPGIVGLMSGEVRGIVFVGSMLLGMGIYRLVVRDS